MLYQYDGGSKLSIEEISKANALRAFLFNKFELRFAGPLFTVLSLDDNELVMINGPAITSRIIFNVDMKLITTTA